MTAPTALEPEVFDICGPLPAPGTTTLLEASAGTGKTWTIAALVTRFVAEGHAPLEKMLVVTFGRAASQELRERVRTQLVAAEQALDAALDGRPSSEPDALVEQLLDADTAELEERRARLRDALTDFDGATIATTHQFCQLVLRSLGVAGDTDAGARLVEDLDDLLVEVVDDLYLRRYAHVDEVPAFDRRTALEVARKAVGDPQARLEPQDAEEGTPAGMRFRFARAVRDEMELRKRRLGVLSYDDLLSRLADALEDDDAPARQRMQERWHVVLVDEFQDTDPVQWQVLDRAFGGQARMVLIGDPKQAIYAFRGGDVVTYLQAEETAHEKRTLGTSYRSDRPLLDSVQAVLRGAALGEEKIVVRDVTAAHPDRRLEGAPSPAPFRIRVVDAARFPQGKSGGRSKGVAIGELRELVAADLAADIKALLASDATFCGRPLRAADVAVLCETRKQCEVARAGLAAAGIQAVIAGSGSVYSTQGADEWLCLLEAMEQPHRSGRVRAAALTTFFGHTAAELDEEGDALTQRVGEVLRDWADLLRLRGVAAVFETAVARQGLVSRALGQEGGERLMTDLRHVGESLHDVASRDRLGLVALLAWMRERMAQARLDVTGERTRRLDSDAAAVQILTIHGSKGLQFPVVHLPFVADLYPRTPAYPLYHDDDGTRCLDVGGSGSGSEACHRATEEEAGEDLRLLYVAMTRAQSQLVTWWFPSAKNTATAPLHRMLFGRRPGQAEVLRSAPVPGDERALEILRHWEAAGGPSVEPVGDRPAVPPPARPGAERLQVRRWTRAVDPVWRRTSYTALSSAAAAAEPVAAFGSEPEVVPKQDEPDVVVPPVASGGGVPSPMADLPVGATFGSLVHAVLETTDPAAPDHGGDLHAALLEQVRAHRVRWPVDVDEEALASALVAVHDSPLGPLAEGRTLRTIGLQDRMAELDFELPLAGGDVLDHPATRARLSDLGPLLRAHLPEGDPLLPYADVLDGEGHAAQLLHGYLTGSVDVVLRLGERFLVVDYKSNWLGGPDEPLTSDHYRPERLAAAMTHSSYPLQALLYAVVLHRFLRWRVRGYEPERHLGGVAYLYLRGMCGPDTPLVDGHPCGVFSWRPPVALVDAVSGLLDGVRGGAGAPGRQGGVGR
ncbi:UvrD-helicase domain-containing protein [Nocardioides caldifontis]|uniref:UvrD-helicase domain-containing protein n=1 Tax=Nocardioides caldifontis TaxID=2588938 RepID=UPI0011DF0E42|nr:UvrD-helicase domain-containing protein [Nocardioides caldifontis]